MIFYRKKRLNTRLSFYLGFVLVPFLALSPSSKAQATPAQTPALEPGRVSSTVTDMNGDPVAGAMVMLTSPDLAEPLKVQADANGFFRFENVRPGIVYLLNVTSPGFADWTSSDALMLKPGQSILLDAIQLKIATQQTTMVVTAETPIEVATEQFKLEETQRVFGIIPNFYVAYDQNAEALTTKMKFQLALRVSVDPVTFVGVGFISGLKQAANSPHYRQGMIGYAERYGATYADGFTDIMIGGAILPSVLHQDPRYFYQGTGSTKSRIRHAVLAPFIARKDNGGWEPNYSTIGGDLGSSAIANLYYPQWNRGAGLVFSNFALNTFERIGSDLAQEFLFARITHHHSQAK
jgi:hypothetical protein